MKITLRRSLGIGISRIFGRCILTIRLLSEALLNWRRLRGPVLMGGWIMGGEHGLEPIVDHQLPGEVGGW